MCEVQGKWPHHTRSIHKVIFSLTRSLSFPLGGYIYRQVPLGPKAAAAVKKNKRMGVSQDKVMKEVSNKEKRQEQLERQAKKAEEALKKAKEAIEENERDLKRLKSNVEPGDNVNGESL